MNRELLQPSLSGGTSQTKSYDIKSLVYVAFFGGAIAVMVLGHRNGRWLRVNSGVLAGLLGLGVLFLGIKAWAVAALSFKVIKSYKLLFQASNILLYFAYYLALKAPYQKHLVLHGETLSLWEDGLLWWILSTVIEVGILFGVYTLTQ